MAARWWTVGREQADADGPAADALQRPGSSRHKVKDADLPVILSRLREFDVRYLFLIGGNDTMDTIHRVTAYARRPGLRTPRRGRAQDGGQRPVRHGPHAGLPQRGPLPRLSVMEAGVLARDMRRWTSSSSTSPSGATRGGWRRRAPSQAGRVRRPAPCLHARDRLRPRPVPRRRGAGAQGLRLRFHRLRRGIKYATARPSPQPDARQVRPTSSTARWPARAWPSNCTA